MKTGSLLVRDVMSRDTFFVHPETSIADCVKGLAKRKLPGAPVADSNGHLIGFVSEQDILPALMQSAYYSEEPRKVETVMQTNPLSVKPNDHIMEIAKMMSEPKPKVYPVVEGEEIIGIITRRHVTQALLEDIELAVPV
ncbi:CBS domain-containing protein [Marinomonas balearica]|uniref:CBS domain protein n=1 Tax=Marinomonas balearica TaxID=491947 RepID=A0A4R6M709_9GAMM|nr:CBS domain-containing protein [Marinomonas balearica]TDO95859.1 CBS domain protein [Marinomonas balearica]